MATLDPLEAIFNIITTFPFNFIIAIVIIAYIIYILYSRKAKKDDVFEIEDFRESVYLATEKLMKAFGISIDATLTRGIEPLGKLTKFYHFKGKVKPLTPEGEQEEETQDADLYIFQVGQKGFFNKIFGGGYIDYIVVNTSQLGTYDGKRRQWPVKEEVSFLPYGNVFISGIEAEAFINDISFRRSQEEILTHCQNFPRKVAYLELKQAKVMERYKASIEQKKSGYDNYKKDVLASGKDIEEEDED